MLIGNRYSDNKLYRGIKHYDSLPLTSGDLHEYADIVQTKNALFMNNLIGSGTLNEPMCTISSAGISLNTPSAVLINGDISLIKDDPNPLVSKAEITAAGATSGLVCMIGWYQSLTSTSTLRSYGGVRNSIIENDIIDANLQIQVSTRYQLRWDIVVIDRDTYESGQAFNISLLNRDAAGNITTGSSSLEVAASEKTVKLVSPPANMTYAVSDLYIVPIVHYTYDNNIITGASAYSSIKVSESGFISSSTEPEGANYSEGTLWYNPATSKIKFYIGNGEFLSASSDISLVQYYNTITINNSYTTPTDILLNIGIPTYNAGDVIQAFYNGIAMIAGVNYDIDTTNKHITLLDATTEAGDTVTIIVIKLIDSTTLSTISTEFNSHIDTYGNSSRKGHVTLSDSYSSSSSAANGVAATPKSVYDATTLIDSVTNKKYRLSITNGVLGVVEIV